SRLGWPAPKNPGAAIDDAEYDLAVLDPLLHQPPDEVKGHGVYLLKANSNLERSLRTRWKRWDTHWWPDADGILKPDAATLEALGRHRMPARSYSPSALQHYAVCPYRFLLYAIHRLKPREESAALERMDPLTRGALFHEVQFRFFGAIRDAGLIPVTSANLDRATDVGDRAFADVASEYEERLAPAIPRVWKSELEDLRIDLRGWIRQLAAIHAEWTPFHFEYAFGLPAGPAQETERDPESLPGDVEILDGVRLRGSIDLVERHRVTNALRVTDHKTGRAPWPEPRLVGKGEVLQPLLYALAVEKVLGQPAKSGVLFYCTQRGGYRSVEIPLNREGRMRIEQVLGAIGDAIGAGSLPAAPRKDACGFCDYRIVCGPYEERRVKEKKERLDALEDVRCLP
ncbi:MAG TPA: PD-(D/E)XK nuclease family protein, partial [Terriglobia bacterium]|nr:PD-(D/E)XK nuclease family protein [Terriglobia bacterium]